MWFFDIIRFDTNIAETLNEKCEYSVKKSQNSGYDIPVAICRYGTAWALFQSFP